MNKKFKFLLLIFIFFSIVFSAFAQKENAPIGGRSAAMAGASATADDFWAVHNNQAGMAYYKNIAAGIYYENRFLVKELGLKAFSFVLPTKKSGVIGLNVSNFGYSQYSETKVGLAYAMAFGPKFSAGVQLDYLYTHIGDVYGNKSSVTFEIGLRSEIIKNLTIAAHVFNPIGIKIASYDKEKIPTIFKIGIAYTFPEKAVIAIETEKDLTRKPVFRAGLEYHVAKPIYIRVGISTNPTTNSLGAGFEFYKFKFDISASYHYVLGFSPQASLLYSFK
jgi:long-subunit fatty acid transport protein